MRTLKPILVMLAGLLAFFMVTEALYFDMGGFGWRKAKQQFGEYGQALGLEFIAPDFDYQIGQLAGTYESHEVRILPDEQARIEVQLNVPERVELSTLPFHRKIPPSGMKQVESRYSSFNRFFKTRYAAPGLARQLAESESLAEFLEVFQEKWGRQLEYLTLSDTTLTASLRYGWQSYIPGDVVKTLLPDLIELAERFEALSFPGMAAISSRSTINAAN